MTLITLTEDNFDSVVDSNEITLIEFAAQWCVPCKTFARIFEQASNEVMGVAFATVDVDEQPTIAKDFAIQSIPHLLVLKKRVAIYSGAANLSLSALKELVLQAKAAAVDDSQ